MSNSSRDPRPSAGRDLDRELAPLALPVGVPRRYSRQRLPAYRHVPGLTPHPVNDPRGHSYGMPEMAPSSACRRLPDSWSRCGEYRFGVDLFNRAFLWEAHEAWEIVWIGAGKREMPAQFVQGLIQVAAALLRAHVGTPAGASSLLEKATTRFDSIEHWLHSTGTSCYMGLDLLTWRPSVERYLESGGDYPFLRLSEPDG